ncbi:unnamed protein product [Urochloa humidicola]
MGTVLPKLAALLQDEEGGEGDAGGGGLMIRGGARRNAAFLREELQHMQGRLLAAAAAAESRGDWESYLEEWSRKLRDLLYDIEDGIDGFLRRAPQRKPGLETTKPHRRFLRFADKVKDLAAMPVRRHLFAGELHGFSSRLKETAERWRQAYSRDCHHRKSIENNVSRWTCWTPSAEPEDRRRRPRPPAFGLCRRDELAEMLLLGEGKDAGHDDDRRAKWLRVVCIRGPGGTGKTTLAMEVFRAIQGHFDCLAWVSAAWVGRYRTSREDVLSSILRQVGGSHGDRERDILLSIREFLMDKRYLVVADGVRNKEAWNLIGPALPFNCLGSRVITTTRCHYAAQSCTDWDSVYRRRLRWEDAEDLFHGRIFGSVESCPPIWQMSLTRS